MARIQVPVEQRVAPQQIQVRAEAPNAAIGAQANARQLQEAGGAVERVGQQMAAFQVDALNTMNEARVNDAMAEAQKTALAKQAEYTELRGANAMPSALDGKPLAEKFGSDFDQSLPQIAADLKLNDVQTELFRRRSQPLALSFRQNATSYERQQADAYKEDVYKTSVATGQQSVLATWSNPEAVALAAENIRTVTLDRARDMGLTPEAAVLAVRENVGKAFLDVIDANADEAPRAMRDFLEQYGDRMMPAQVEAAKNKINPGVAGIEATEWVSSMLAGGAPPLPGEPGATIELPLPGARVEFEAPVEGARVSSGYGPRASFRTSNGARASSNHDGVDFAARAGIPVRAVASGRVRRANVNGGYGNYVEIEHPDGTVTGYAHLQGFNVRDGDVIARGQTIGAVGSTGNSTGPHLHLRAMRDGKSIDPAELFQGGVRTATTQSIRSSGVTPTQAEMLRAAQEQFGENPVQLAAARAEINRAFALRDAEKADRERAARDSVYAYIEQNRAMPPASMLAALPPGSLNSVQNYLDALIKPPARENNEATVLALVANPDAWKQMAPQEFVATYGRDLSAGTLQSFVGQLGNAQSASTTKVDVFPAEAFSRSFNRTFQLAGVDTTPSNKNKEREMRDRQDMARITELTRQRVMALQQEKGRQLTEAEIDVEMSRAVGQLQWERPGNWAYRGTQGFVTSYSTMPDNLRTREREALREQGVANPTEDQIFLNYLNRRLR